MIKCGLLETYITIETHMEIGWRSVMTSLTLAGAHNITSHF